MNRKWRSQSWKKAHPLSFRDWVTSAAREQLDWARRVIGKIALPEPLKYIDLAAGWRAQQGIEGDYCEFGVYTGRQFVHAYRAINKSSKSKKERFYAFDSFEGLPKIEPIDMVYPSFAQGGLAATQAEFVENLKKFKVDLSRVEIVSGWYSETLQKSLPAQIGLSQVAIALIDCDLYASAIVVLDFLTDLLVDGSILIFDDWSLFRGHPDLGSQRAFREWQTKAPHLRFSPLPSAPYSFQKAFIVHLPLNSSEQENANRH